MPLENPFSRIALYEQSSKAPKYQIYGNAFPSRCRLINTPPFPKIRIINMLVGKVTFLFPKKPREACLKPLRCTAACLGSGLAILHSRPATESFNSSDRPADAGIMNSPILSNFSHPIPMLHVGTINYLIVPTFPPPFLSPKYLRQRRLGHIPLRPRHLLDQILSPQRFSEPRQEIFCSQENLPL